MSEYTPTTDILRDLWVDHLLDPLPRSEGIPLVPAVQAAFDGWLAAHDRDVSAKAWDEGERHESHFLTTCGQFCPYEHCNPYREEDA